ncbi:hypothetical protein DXG01_016611 [Tephrocybe rancida]|nr:hypothetical protein DXG01_016611 [Tephrocybe rancida]
MTHRLYISRHQPLITARVEFSAVPAVPQPALTSQIEFTNEQMAYLTEEPDPTNRPPSPELDLETPAGLKMIKKPKGEPSRPGSGGYRLETLLEKHKWAPSAIEALKEAVKAAAAEQLDMTKSYHFQDKMIIKTICDEVRRRFRRGRTANFATDDERQRVAKFGKLYPMLASSKHAEVASEVRCICPSPS